MTEIESQVSNSSEEETQVVFQDTQQGFNGELCIPNSSLIKSISKLKLDLKNDKVFSLPNVASKLLKGLTRQNNIYYFVKTMETSVDIKDVEGSVYLPLLTRMKIRQDLEKIPRGQRETISNLHLGAVQILLEGHFRAGINSPIKMALLDNRIKNRQDCILGCAKGNLAHQRFMFTVYPKFALNINDQNLDKVLSFVHKFERTGFMEPGSKVLSLTYCISYALTNSHHSIRYRNQKSIELASIFEDIGRVEQCSFAEIDNEDQSWAIDIARNKSILGRKPSQRVTGNTLEVGSSSRLSKESEPASKRDLMQLS